MNNLSNATLDLNCTGDDRYFGLQHLAVNTNFTWCLYTAYFQTVSYDCDAKWANGHLKFNAFKDTKDFVDDGCGGRHCIWKATDFGLYLYQIQQKKFVFKFGWGNNKN